MIERRKRSNDPRLQTPPGYFTRRPANAPGEPLDPSLFSKKDLFVFAFLLISCLIVAAVLWTHPPQLLYFNNPAADASATLASRPLSKLPSVEVGYDATKFEEIADDDPDIVEDLSEPLPEDAEAPAPTLIKS
jgi:hypothetical protein